MSGIHEGKLVPVHDGHDIDPSCAEHLVGTCQIQKWLALVQPLEGDIEGQAMAWRAVCEALEQIGLNEFFGSKLLAPHRERVIEFIRYLGRNQKESGTGAEILVWPS